jgi:hypothetical protein
MRKILLWIGSVALATGVTIAAMRERDRHHARAHQLETKASEAQQPGQVPGTASSGDVHTLKAELAKKEAIIAALAVAKAQAQAPTQGAAGAPPSDPAAEAARILDGRLDESSPPSPAVLRIGAKIRTLVREGILGDTRLTDLKCAGVLCRITLSDPQTDRLERTVQRLADNAGKDMGASVILDRGAGEKLIYAATTSRDLALPEDSSTLAAQQAEQAQTAPLEPSHVANELK